MEVGNGGQIDTEFNAWWNVVNRFLMVVGPVFYSSLSAAIVARLLSELITNVILCRGSTVVGVG